MITKNTFSKHIISIISLACFLLMIVGSENDTTTAEATKSLAGPAIKITAEQLQEEFKNNEIRAVRKYKDKVVEVTGKIYGFDSGFTDTAVKLTLEAGGGWSNVMCDFPKDQADNIFDLNKGDYITVKGICTGVIMGSPTMDNCILVNK